MTEEIDASRIAPEILDRVIETLEPFLTEERRARFAGALDTRTRDVVMVLEDIANEHNGAAVLRTAEAFGFFEVHVIEPQHSRFKISRKIAKGAEKWLDLRRYASAKRAYEMLREQGRKIWASTLHGDAVDVHQIPIDDRLALVFGNELLGLSPEAIARADGYFRIPMSGFVESFNISVAAAITCWDVSLRRRERGIFNQLDPDDRRRVHASWLVQSLRSSPQILERAQLPVPVLHTNRFVLIGDADET